MQNRRNTSTWLMVLAVLAMVLPTQIARAQDVGGPGAGDGTPTTTTPENGGNQNGGDTDNTGEDDGGNGGENDEENGGDNGGGGGAGFLEGSGMLLLMLAGFMVLWIFMGRSRRKQQQKRKEMLGQLKKGDKVITIGGILGTVMEVRANEVSVKVDETNNTRMHFARWAIQSVGQEPTDDNPNQQ
ncbi:MAG: preprotein translocase subunit YajC [Phycisphaerae bacterium]